MPISFPSNPTTNQTYTYNNKTWQWNGSQWDAVGNVLSVAVTAPVTNSGTLYSPVLGIASNPTFTGTVTASSLSASSLTVSGSANFNNFDVAGKNKIINGGFDFWQRGTSSTSLGYATADRWYSSGSGTVTFSQQTTGVPVGSRYCIRVAYGANNSNANLFNALEAAEAKALAGQTVTLSVKVRANSTWAATGSQGLNMWLQKNSTADTMTGGTWSVLLHVGVNGASIATGTSSTSWTTLSGTVTIPNDGTAAGLRVGIAENVVGPNGAYYEVSQVQMEIGSVATLFSRAGGTLQGELAACQRYFARISSPGNYSSLCSEGGALTGTIAQSTLRLPVTMRTAPTSVTAPNVAWWNYGNTNYYAGGSFTLNKATNDYAQVRYTHGSSIFTAGQSGVFVDNNSTSGSFDFNAEL